MPAIRGRVTSATVRAVFIEGARQAPPAGTGGVIRTTISANGDRRPCRRFGSRLRVPRNLMNHRQLQHGYPLPFTELRHQHITSIWKFDRIMVAMRNVRVYRAEFAHSKIDRPRPNPSVVVFDVFGERQLGP